MDKFLSALGLVVAAIFGMVLSTIFSGFVMSKLWDWFMVTTFALPQLTITAAIGISMTVSFITGVYSTAKTKGLGESILISFFTSGFILLFGYIIHLFM